MSHSISNAESMLIRQRIEREHRWKERVTRFKRTWMNTRKWFFKRRWQVATLVLATFSSFALAHEVWRYLTDASTQQPSTSQFVSTPVAAPDVDAGLQLKLSPMISPQSFQSGDSK